MIKKLLICLSLLATSNCAVYMAANQPAKKDLAVLEKGTPRSIVLGGLGQPANTEKENGVKKDYFYFSQGYTKGTKAFRTGLHAILDVATFGLWEVVGTPMEVMVSGSKTSVEITYTKDDKIDTVKMFSEDDKNKIVN
jgi:hypothetical protein